MERHHDPSLFRTLGGGTGKEMPKLGENAREPRGKTRRTDAESSHDAEFGAASLGHMPAAEWRFDESVTAVFDDMLARSVPQHDAMRDSVFQVASHLVQPHTHIVDLGCSLGASMAPLIERFGKGNRYVGIEASKPMAEACRRRLRSSIDAGLVEIHNVDLRAGYPEVQASVTLAVLTLMFLPVADRPRILTAAHRRATPGGALILVEKILGNDAATDELLVDFYHGHKETMGYSREEIDRKHKALRDVLVPLSADANERMLRQSGFTHVECFWRCLNFCAWLALKENNGMDERAVDALK